ncbi:hypothetical protein N7509_000627 [Penicillium cosmopolitanum]|uniref:Uncharacterized protein n=1 Tax=Penicillium cosmopolitanum TaxID=1131564 RepID=A0A9W9WAU8_9EURO|nr:uncharacterized protein N7509_000627 [Penicillium cosmopolitanum]KAJ5414000.1 hypothetical protein N7509_000627 [Penicillium cosmopolitanum]
MANHSRTFEHGITDDYIGNILVEIWIHRVKVNRHDANEPYFNSDPAIPIDIQDPGLNIQGLEASESFVTDPDPLQQQPTGPWAPASASSSSGNLLSTDLVTAIDVSQP